MLCVFEQVIIFLNLILRSLAVGTKVCYRLFSLSSVDRLDLIYESSSELDGDVCLVERLFSSSLVAVVSLSSPRKLKVCHFKKGTEICNYSYSNTILAVKLNRAVRRPINNIFVYMTFYICSFLETCSMSGGVTIHPQYKGYEGLAYYKRHPSKSSRIVCSVPQ